jgi:predicted TIM-barrel fold metal-dependent hydrolase
MITTPWGDMEVADAHVHYFSPEFFRFQAEQKGAKEVGSLLGWEVPETSEDLADRWVVEMNHQGVANAVLVASVPGDVDSVATAVDRHPERFQSIVMLNPLPPGADMRCSRALEEGFVKGIFLFPAMHKYSIHDTRVLSLLSIVSGFRGTVVYVHFGMLSVGFRKKLGLPSQFDMRFSNPIDLHAIALSFPHVNFVIPHFGAGYFREALMVADLCPNVYLDTSSSNKWMRCEPGVTDLAGVFRRALDVVGPKRLLFGTDSSWFPRGWVRGVFDEQVLAMQAAGVDAETARGILGGNLRALFRG